MDSNKSKTSKGSHPLNDLMAFTELERLAPNFKKNMTMSLKQMTNQPLVEEVKEEEEDRKAPTFLDEKVPVHSFTIEDIEYEWYEGSYYKKVIEKHTGDSFGELALKVEKGVGTRAATIKCEGDCHFAILNKEEYMSSLARIDARMVMEQVDFLNNIPCFKT